jgi:hypothetical protein
MTCASANVEMRISDVGFWSGAAAATATTVFVVVQTFQLLGWLHFPWDEILIYSSSLCIVIPFVMQMVAFDHLTHGDKRYWTRTALMFTGGYAVFVTTNYVVQLATVIPARLRGEGEALRLLEQTPHSLFWDFDALGYIAMGLATLVAIPALDRVGFEGRVRWTFIAHAVTTPLIAVVYFAPTFSTGLLLLGLPWAVTAPVFMAMLAVLLRNRQ